jgi:hypothetical protein
MYTVRKRLLKSTIFWGVPAHGHLRTNSRRKCTKSFCQISPTVEFRASDGFWFSANIAKKSFSPPISPTYANSLLAGMFPSDSHQNLFSSTAGGVTRKSSNRPLLDAHCCSNSTFFVRSGESVGFLTFF